VITRNCSTVSALVEVHAGSTDVPPPATVIYWAVQSYESGTLTIFPDAAGEQTSANWSGVGTTGIFGFAVYAGTSVISKQIQHSLTPLRP
jgi:hypothetical protein